MKGTTWLTLKGSGIRPIWLRELLARLRMLLLFLSLISAKLTFARQVSPSLSLLTLSFIYIYIYRVF
jgi:hypothetical protein